ncbi:MAG: hypothetical protein QMD50_03420 [Patescibacteria group bacterium]|nr:hypothetical protein [Patescibacteria group bacterium]
MKFTEFKTKKSRIWTASILGIITVVAFVLVFVLATRFSSATVNNKEVSGVGFVIFFVIYAIAGATALSIFNTKSKEEEKKKEQQDFLDGIMSHVRILTDAFIKYWPYEVGPSDPMPEDYVRHHIIYESLLPFAEHIKLHGDQCHDEFCENKVERINKNINILLAILAKRYSVAALSQTTVRNIIRRYIEANEKGGSPLNFEAVEIFTASREKSDKLLEETKNEYWKVHGAVKGIGAKTFPEYRDYLLLWEDSYEKDARLDELKK